MRFWSFFCAILLLSFQLVWAESMAESNFLAGLDEEEETQKKVVPRAVPNPARDNLNAVLKSIDDSQVIKLSLAGDEKFVGVYKKALAKKAKGNVLILPGDGLYPTRLINLINQMTDKGWNALSLSLNYYPRNDMLAGRTIEAVEILAKMPKKDPDEKATDAENAQEDDFKVADLNPPPNSMATANTSFDEETDTQKTKLPVKRPILEVQGEFKQGIYQRFKSGLTWLTNNTSFRMRTTLVLHREAGYWLAENLDEVNLPKNSPIVLLNVVAPKKQDIKTLSASLEKLGKRPILDIYNPNNSQELKLAKLRKAAYKRAGNDLAIQVKEYSQITDREKSMKLWLAQRVSAWIRSLDKPKVKDPFK